MKKLAAYLCFALACISTSHAETIAGYSFEKYPAKIYNGKQAPLKLGDWSSFRTRLKEAHKDGEINFAGNYIVTTWGCGTSCVSGSMIDKRTGKVYDIPLGETEGVSPLMKVAQNASQTERNSMTTSVWLSIQIAAYLSAAIVKARKSTKPPVNNLSPIMSTFGMKRPRHSN